MTIDIHAHWSPPELIEIYRVCKELPMIVRLAPLINLSQATE
ncbi:MAG: hypothetical protein CFH41_02584 [Alphaproteobacteria bacterium MarineAlpha11_Bin1]|nr:MAG: hypothetical protein CFH41_02584 [Alphaproteobacteria bacterium MarineAlpha11_Bin1]